MIQFRYSLDIEFVRVEILVVLRQIFSFEIDRTCSKYLIQFRNDLLFDHSFLLYP